MARRRIVGGDGNLDEAHVGSEESPDWSRSTRPGWCAPSQPNLPPQVLVRALSNPIGSSIVAFAASVGNSQSISVLRIRLGASQPIDIGRCGERESASSGFRADDPADFVGRPTTRKALHPDICGDLVGATSDGTRLLLPSLEIHDDFVDIGCGDEAQLVVGRVGVGPSILDLGPSTIEPANAQIAIRARRRRDLSRDRV